MRSQWFWNIAARDLMSLTPSPPKSGALSGASMPQVLALVAVCAVALASAYSLVPGGEAEVLAMVAPVR